MHTEESLMALADRYGCETVLDYNSRKASEAFADLRLAIREVLKENFTLAAGQCIVDGGLVMGEYGSGVCTMKERAERAEAEVARMKRVDDEATRLAIQVSELKAECERNRKDAERGRFMLKHGEWRRNSEYRTAHIAVAVPFDSDLSCYATREAAIDAAMQEKQPRFNVVYCSQCGGAFGPGDHGYSHCSDHAMQESNHDRFTGSMQTLRKADQSSMAVGIGGYAKQGRAMDGSFWPISRTMRTTRSEGGEATMTAKLPPPDEDDDEDCEPVCPECNGTETDKWCDDLLPCPLCQGEQKP